MSTIKFSGMKISLLRVASGAEVITGMVLSIYPDWLIKMLFGTDVIGAGIAAGRVAGIALLALGIGCWRAVQLVGPLLLPATLLHAVLAGIMAYTWRKAQ